jgi:hypothetical protein
MTGGQDNAAGKTEAISEGWSGKRTYPRVCAFQRTSMRGQIYKKRLHTMHLVSSRAANAPNLKRKTRWRQLNEK